MTDAANPFSDKVIGHDAKSGPEGPVILLVSPHSGILETWLPVLWRLRGLKPEIEIHAVLPRPEDTPSLPAKDFSVGFSCALIDSWIQALPTGKWLSLSGPRMIRPARLAARVVRRLRRSRLSQHRMDRNQSARSLALAFRARFGNKFAESVATVLCDLGELRHPELARLVEIFPNARIISQAHGIDLRELPESESATTESAPRAGEVMQGRQVMALLLSERELDYYRRRFDLDHSQIRIQGVLRHDREWLEFLCAGPFLGRPVEERYIFLASRPISEDVLPRAAKHRILREIREYARQRNQLLVIRKHPVERTRGSAEIEDCLGRPGRSSGWMESYAHPMHLGLHADLNFTLYSSLAIDLACLGRNVIEPIDFGACPNTAPNIRVGEDGTKSSFYQQAGFSRRAMNATDFAKAAESFDDRPGVVASPTPNYQRHYADPDGAVRNVICTLMSGTEARSAVWN